MGCFLYTQVRHWDNLTTFLDSVIVSSIYLKMFLMQVIQANLSIICLFSICFLNDNIVDRICCVVFTLASL